MAKRCGIIDGIYVMMDRVFSPTFDNGTIFTNLSQSELCIVMAGEKKLIRVDGGTGIDGVQRVITKIEKNEDDDIIVYYKDLTAIDGIIVGISEEDNYVVGD